MYCLRNGRVDETLQKENTYDTRRKDLDATGRAAEARTGYMRAS